MTKSSFQEGDYVLIHYAEGASALHYGGEFFGLNKYGVVMKCMGPDLIKVAIEDLHSGNEDMYFFFSVTPSEISLVTTNKQVATRLNRR